MSAPSAHPADLDYPTDDEVEAFYSDAADETYPTDEQLCILREQGRELTAAACLVESAELERAEFRTRMLLERAQRIVGDIPEEEATDADLDYVTAAYMTWCEAWEALRAHKRLQVQA